jgi:hypothetical protein
LILTMLKKLENREFQSISNSLPKDEAIFLKLLHALHLGCTPLT